MTPQELKNSILQLAIQGKLVEQRAEEGTAAELLRDILTQRRVTAPCGWPQPVGTRPSRAEREPRDAAVGRSPRDRRVSARNGGRGATALPPIPDDEKPFDIPDSWEWVRLGEVASIERGSGIKRSETSSSGFPCVRYGEIYTTYGYSFTSTKSFVTENVASSCHKANHGDVLCTLTGEWKEEIAKATAYLGKSPIAVGGDLAKISSHAFNPVLLVYFFFAPFMIQQKAAKANGTMIVHIGKEAVCNLFIPLPPLAEQKRIVAKIEELLPLIDRYEKAWSKLEDFNKRFPVDMQKSLLQMAIQGKLVEQRAEEGTAAELLRDILTQRRVTAPCGWPQPVGTRPSRAEREPRDAEVGRSPRDRRVSARNGGRGATALPPIPDDEKPFDIPESWEWVRLGEVCTIARGGSPRPIKDYITTAADGINWIKIGDTEKDGKYICSTAEKIKPSGVSKSRMVHAGDFLLTNSMSFGRPYILKVNGCIHDGWLVISQGEEIFDQDYLYWVLSSGYAYSQFCAKVSGAVVKNLNSDKVANSVLPLPPLAEQKRIVAKLEELLPLCERLK